MMKEHRQNEYDVVVVGLGTAGALALIAAAKLGLKTIGVERLNAMGGTGTLGGIGGYYFGSRGGLFEDINKQVFALQHNVYTNSSSPKFDAKATVLEQTAAQYGAEFLYETVVTGVVQEGTTVKGIHCFGHGESFTLSSRFVIDCTGDASVCSLCGCETTTGREFDGQTQPFSNVVITMTNGKISWTNIDAGYVDQTNSEDLSKAIVNSLTIPNYLMSDYRSASNFITNASILGVREGRTIVGEERVTLAGYFHGECINKPVFYAYSNIDNHSKDTAFEDAAMKDWYLGAGLWGVCFSVGVPMGALIPKDYNGILAAGRCISVDHSIASLIRMKSDMEKCGEAAATIAYLALKNGVSAKDVDYHQLSELLISTRCLNPQNDVGFSNRTEKGTIPFQWMKNAEDIKAGLSSNAPGIAIWSARLLGNSMIETLVRWLDEDDQHLKKHTALALGLLGDRHALPLLRQMAAERDTTIPNSTVKYVYTLGTSAVYLLGKLGDADSIDILCDVVKDKGEFDQALFVRDALHATPDDIRFQLYSYAITSLISIRNQHPSAHNRIDCFLKKNVLDNPMPFRISLKSNNHAKFDIYPRIRAYILKHISCT